MFESRDKAVQRILRDLRDIDLLGSTKLYLCWYDDLLIPDSEWKGVYPCSDKSVDLKEVIDIIRQNFKRQCIIRHNVMLTVPIGLPVQTEIEKYVEVCLVY